jgi:RNA polymerase sigma factor (sigma-70 family)
MTDSPMTRVSLLVRIRDRGDEDAWAEFVDLYAPLVYALARRRGLQEADAADLTQDVLRSVVRTAPRFAYDPGRGSFRGWLFTVARNQLRKWAHARQRQPSASGSPDDQRLIEEQAAPPEDGNFWEAEYRERLFAWAAERVRPSFRPSTWQAFWKTAVEERDPAAVAAELGMSVGAVYIARTRVLARLRECIRKVQDG